MKHRHFSFAWKDYCTCRAIVLQNNDQAITAENSPSNDFWLRGVLVNGEKVQGSASGFRLGEYTREELALALLEGAIDNRDEVEMSVGDWCTVKQFADMVDQKPGTATQPAQVATHRATSPNQAMSNQTLIPVLASIAVSAIAVTVALIMFWPKGERADKSPTPEQTAQTKQEPVRPRIVENKEPETIPELTAPELSARKTAVVPIGVQIAGDFLICGTATVTEGNRAVTSGLVADYIINTIQLAKKERPKDPIGAAIRFNGTNLGIDKFKFHSKRRPDQIEYNVAWAKVIDQVSANWNQQLPTKPLARIVRCCAWHGTAKTLTS